jgi:hypothetical protein
VSNTCTKSAGLAIARKHPSEVKQRERIAPMYPFKNASLTAFDTLFTTIYIFSFHPLSLVIVDMVLSWYFS